ncbi:MAG: FtsH protease activity modulator HflK [Cardiobacteriaceae bacterium]|nr:FtsH protease activity modulator HflK [Cardiobacteriaceae bacterium]
MFSFLLGYFSRQRKPQVIAMSQDPWGNNDSDNDKKNNNQPPDLDEFFNKLLRLRPRKNTGGEGGGSRMPVHISGKFLFLLVCAGLCIWLATGVYTVRERENGVETFLGRYLRTTKAGLNWHFPAPVGQVSKVDVTSISSMQVGELKSQSGRISTSNQRNGQMLTSDENIVEIGAAVQYRIRDAKNYLFQSNQPEEVLRDIVISAIREVVGSNTVDDILIDKRGEWPQEAKQIIDKTLEQYNLGFEIVAFELQDARAPVEVQDAFEDAVRAREDEERLGLEAEAYARERIPVARGEAKRLLQAAQAYKAETLARATADSSRFNNLLGAYRENPAVMRERLYLDTMASVYAHSNKVLVDADNSRPIINLGAAPDLSQVFPVVQESVSQSSVPAPVVVQPSTTTYKAPVNQNNRNDERSRSR